MFDISKLVGILNSYIVFLSAFNQKNTEKSSSISGCLQGSDGEVEPKGC